MMMEIENEMGTLSIWKIRDIMKNVQEPIIKFYGIPVYFMLFCAIVAVFHWIGEIDPELIDEYGEDKVKTFMYNGSVQNVIAGLPNWTFASIIWFAVGTLSGIYATTLWRVDEQCYDEAGKIDKVRINTDGGDEVEMMKDDETAALSDNAVEQQSIVTTDI